MIIERGCNHGAGEAGLGSGGERSGEGRLRTVLLRGKEMRRGRRSQKGTEPGTRNDGGHRGRERAELSALWERRGKGREIRELDRRKRGRGTGKHPLQKRRLRKGGAPAKLGASFPGLGDP